MYEQVSPDNWENIIRAHYLMDKDFIEKFHSCADKGFEACVESCMHNLVKSGTPDTIRMYQTEVGFITLIEQDMGTTLYQFFIRPEERNRENRKAQLDLAKELTNRQLYAFIYEKNEPVLRFYKKHGKFISKYTNNDEVCSAYLLKE